MRMLYRRLAAEDQIAASAQSAYALEIGSRNPSISENCVSVRASAGVSIVTGVSQCLVDMAVRTKLYEEAGYENQRRKAANDPEGGLAG